MFELLLLIGFSGAVLASFLPGEEPPERKCPGSPRQVARKKRSRLTKHSRAPRRQDRSMRRHSNWGGMAA